MEKCFDQIEYDLLSKNLASISMNLWMQWKTAEQWRKQITNKLKTALLWPYHISSQPRALLLICMYIWITAVMQASAKSISTLRPSILNLNFFLTLNSVARSTLEQEKAAKCKLLQFQLTEGKRLRSFLRKGVRSLRIWVSLTDTRDDCARVNNIYSTWPPIQDSWKYPRI